MIADRTHNYISPEEYLKLEELSPLKHEYIQGEIYARADANDAHVTVAGNLCTLLRNHVRGGGCRMANASKLYVNIIWYIGEELLSTYKTFN